MLNLFLNVDNPVVRKKNQLILFSSILLSKIQQPIPRVGGRMVLFYMQGFLLSELVVMHKIAQDLEF